MVWIKWKEKISGIWQRVAHDRSRDQRRERHHSTLGLGGRSFTTSLHHSFTPAFPAISPNLNHLLVQISLTDRFTFIQWSFWHIGRVNWPRLREFAHLCLFGYWSLSLFLKLVWQSSPTSQANDLLILSKMVSPEIPSMWHGCLGSILVVMWYYIIHTIGLKIKRNNFKITTSTSS